MQTDRGQDGRPPFKLFLSQLQRNFQESGVSAVPGSPTHRRWFKPSGTSTYESYAPGAPRPASAPTGSASTPTFYLQLFSARPAPQTAASLAQITQSPHRSTWSQQSHCPFWRPVVRPRVAEEDYRGEVSTEMNLVFKGPIGWDKS